MPPSACPRICPRGRSVATVLWACHQRLVNLRPGVYGGSLIRRHVARKDPMTEALRSVLIGVCALVSGFATGGPAYAQGIDPRAEIAVCTAPHLSSSTHVTGDGLGGVLVTWVDFRSDTLGDVYVQRLSSEGVVKWQTNGVAVCSTPGAQTRPTAIADGSGGAYVAWQDDRGIGSRVYLQRVDHSGLPVFANEGSRVCTAAGQEFSPAITRDGAGGVFVAWLDYRGGPLGHYAQRIGQDGTLLWSGDGVVIDTSLGALAGFPPRLLAAGQGRVIALTQKVGRRFLARKLGEQGQPLWSADGVSPCTSCVPTNVRAVSDGAGGADLVWTEITQAGESRVIAQRISTEGELQWGNSGQIVFSSSSLQDLPSIVSSGDGGAFVVWRNAGFANPRICAQRLAPDGAKLWGVSGIRAAPVGRDQGALAIAEGGGGELLMLWQMFFESVDYDMFIQRFDGSGAAQWQTDGSRLPTQSQSNDRAHIEGDGAGGATVVWEGVRGGTATINAERINRWGFAGPLPAKSAANSVYLWSPAPNPTDRAVTIRVDVRSTMRLSLDVIDIAGRHVKSILSGDVTPGLHSFGWDGKGDDGTLSPSGLYFVRCTSQNGSLVTRVQLVR